jgi:hypothetical protein
MLFAAKLIGVQKVVPNKRPGETPRDVYMQMAIVRIKKYQCDVLMTLNTELESLKGEDVTMSEGGAPALLPGVSPTLEGWVQAAFNRMVNSFRHTSEPELTKLFC